MQASPLFIVVGVALAGACDIGPGASDHGTDTSSDAASDELDGDTDAGPETSTSEASASTSEASASTSEASASTSEASASTGEASASAGETSADAASGTDGSSSSGAGEPETDSSDTGPDPAGSRVFTVRADADRLVFAEVDLDDGSETILDDSVELEPGERLVALSPIGPGRFVASSVYTSAGVHSRLTFLDPQGNADPVEALGLQPNWSIENLLGLDDTQAIAVVSLSGGVTPFVFADVDLTTLQVTVDEDAPPISLQQRVDDLTRCPDGTIYLTSVAGEGTFRLGRLVPGAPMLTLLANYSIAGQSGIGFPMDLDCAADGTLYMLADADNDAQPSLFTVDTATSELTFERDLDANNIAFDVDVPN